MYNYDMAMRPAKTMFVLLDYVSRPQVRISCYACHKTSEHIIDPPFLTLSVLMSIKVDIRGRVLKSTKVDIQGSSAVT